MRAAVACLRRFLLLGLALGLAACAIGNKQDYLPIQTQLPFKGRGEVAVLAYDQRPYVRDDDKNPDFVGLQLNRFGIPFGVHTKSGRPLADELGDAFARSLTAAGFTARSVLVAPEAALADAKTALLGKQPHRALLLRIDQWESSTYVNTTLEYDLTATVYDDAGKALANYRIAGSEELGGQLLGAARKARESVPAALPGKIESLLNAPVVRAALSS